LTFLNG